MATAGSIHITTAGTALIYQLINAVDYTCITNKIYCTINSTIVNLNYQEQYNAWVKDNLGEEYIFLSFEIRIEMQ